jgi:hypothetical protein
MNPIKTTPKDFFLNLAVIACVYISAISLLTLLFDIINNVFPDPLAYSDPYSAGMRMAIASLIVIYPLFLILSWILNSDISAFPEKATLPVRRWLTYLTLFVAGTAIVVDLIVLLNTFLNGEVSSRFVFKVLAVLIVAGLMLGYYIYSLKRTITPARKFNSVFAIVGAVIIIGSLVWGFTVIGSPQNIRNIKLDMQRVSDLENIQYQITTYWQQKQKLPATISDLIDPLSGGYLPKDPQSSKDYDYTVLGTQKFKLCATFALESQDLNRHNGGFPNYLRGPYPITNDAWKHEPGYQCFERTIDPDKYPPMKPPMGY